MGNKNRNTVVIGGGFAGLSAATTLASEGFDVTLLEKNATTGGRARLWQQDGFVFDMGPSWYWMPEVMEEYFNRFGKSTAGYFDLVRLDPSYQVVFNGIETWTITAGYEALKQTFEALEPGSGHQLDAFLKEAQLKYEVGMRDFVRKPSISWTEFMEPRLLKPLFQIDLLQSFSKHVRRYFKHPHIIQLLEFPVLFLGAMPNKIPALYSMMNYADIKLGTWYPMGGMYKLTEAMTALAIEKGVKIKNGAEVLRLDCKGQSIDRIHTSSGEMEADIVVAAADYHHVEQHLLPVTHRQYSPNYWNKRVLAPSCLLYYVGVNKKLPRLLHHTIFFEQGFDRHAAAIYDQPQWPENPSFYVCCPSKTDSSVAPAGMENLFILIPVATGIEETEAVLEKYFKQVINKLEKYCGEKFEENIVLKRSYAGKNFNEDYHAFKGNAYGLANTLMQTAFLKPSMKSSKVNNLFYTGQLTVPGPGVPPSIISGQVVAAYIKSKF